MAKNAETAEAPPALVSFNLRQFPADVREEAHRRARARGLYPNEYIARLVRFHGDLADRAARGDKAAQAILDGSGLESVTR